MIPDHNMNFRHASHCLCLKESWHHNCFVSRAKCFLTRHKCGNTVFWDVTLCSLVEVYQYFGGIYSIYLQDRRISLTSRALLGVLFSPEVRCRMSISKNAKMFLCLLKHYAMKTYVGVAVWIHVFLTIDIRWRWMVSVTPWPLWRRGKIQWYPLDRKLDGP
jgi:hypothetical protein